MFFHVFKSFSVLSVFLMPRFEHYKYYLKQYNYENIKIDNLTFCEWKEVFVNIKSNAPIEVHVYFSLTGETDYYFSVTELNLVFTRSEFTQEYYYNILIQSIDSVSIVDVEVIKWRI